MNNFENISKIEEPQKNISEVLQYDLNGHIIKEWSSAREAERQLKIPNVNILRCCCGGFFMKSRNKWVQTKQAGGFIWRYKYE